MLHRFSAILLALAAIVSLVSAPLTAVGPALQFGQAEAGTTKSGCCGESCCCAQSCPCVNDGRSTRPVERLPAAPTSSREQRTIFLHLPSLVATLLLEPAQTSCTQTISSRPLVARVFGRALLEQISRWTT
ncbi:MAG: hypothetical protein DWI09_09255 [Planctomycetota bacterium]|nr:MAG: hypothetical protein DWI09_09255 [Planctomycetota bacterium]